ncbi:MAG: peptidyl-prolyl cis-trans isomerase [Hyphomicrobium sp.]
MLESIRNFSSSPFGKAIFILVLVAFGSGFWYYGNPFSTGPETDWAVRIGEHEVTPAVIQSDYERELNRVRERSGGQFDGEQAKAAGLPGMVVARIVNQTLLDLAAADLNLIASDDFVRSTIMKNPAFHGPTGTFSRDIYAQTLRQSGLNERRFEVIVRRDLERNQLAGSLAAGVVVPPSMLDALYRQYNEKRIAEVIHVPHAQMTDIPQPTEQELNAYHSENAQRFTAPEYRAMTAVVLRVEDLAKEIAVSEQEIQKAYDERAAEFARPESRTLQQMVFTTEDEAKQAHAEVTGGADFVRVAEERAGLSADAVEVGNMARHELLPPLADVAFALAEGAVSPPVQSPLGWHLIKVTRIAPEEVQPVDKVRDQIAAELAREKAGESLYRVGNDLQDILAGGASLEEAASQLGVPLLRLPRVDAQGLNIDGESVPDAPDQLIATAFTLGSGEESLLTDLDTGGYFVVRVDEIVPPALRPLDAVRDQVAEAVIAEHRAQAAALRAEALAEKARAGGDLATHARDAGFSVLTTDAFTRTGTPAADLPAPLIEALFAAKQGEPVVVKGAETSYVAQVTNVIEADPAAAPDQVEALADDLQASIGTDIMVQYLNALRQRYPVVINPQVMDTLF